VDHSARANEQASFSLPRTPNFRTTCAAHLAVVHSLSYDVAAINCCTLETSCLDQRLRPVVDPQLRRHELGAGDTLSYGCANRLGPKRAVASARGACAAREAGSIAQKTAGFEKLAGYFNLYWDARRGKLWLEVDTWDSEFLYVDSLLQGVGSNDLGLDRRQPGDSRLVKFERVGPKVLLIQSNYSFRAVTDDPDERQTAEEAFATSTLWGFTVAAEEGNHTLVDATDFFLHDAHNVAAVLMPPQSGYKNSLHATGMPQSRGYIGLQEGG